MMKGIKTMASKPASNVMPISASDHATSIINSPPPDLNKLSDAELEIYLKKKKEMRAKLLTPEKKAEIIESIEAFILKTHGYTLSDVGLAEEKKRNMPAPRTYKNP